MYDQRRKTNLQNYQRQTPKKREPIDVKGLVELSKKIELENNNIYKS